MFQEVNRKMIKSSGIIAVLLGLLLLTYGAIKISRSAAPPVVSGSAEFTVQGADETGDNRQTGEQFAAAGGLLAIGGLALTTASVRRRKK
jgi:hypothetical protein